MFSLSLSSIKSEVCPGFYKTHEVQESLSLGASFRAHHQFRLHWCHLVQPRVLNTEDDENKGGDSQDGSF